MSLGTADEEDLARWSAHTTGCRRQCGPNLEDPGSIRITSTVEGEVPGYSQRGRGNINARGMVCPPISAVRAVPTDGPPPAFMAALNAVVKSVCAIWATGSPRCSVPVNIPGPSVFGAVPNPVIEAAGHIPISPLTIVGPVLLTEGVAPRIPKLQAAPNAMTGGGVPHVEGVVNVHTLLAAR